MVNSRKTKKASKDKRANGQLPLTEVVPPELAEIWSRFDLTYNFVGEAGRGRTGIAYTLRAKKTGQLVCLKTINPSVTDEETLQRVSATLAKEIRILLPLTHRFLPTIYDFEESSKWAAEPSDAEGRGSRRPFYLCTFHPGETFAKFIENAGIFTLEDSYFVVSGLMNVLEYLHTHGRTHCDLHTKNILVSKDILRHGFLVIDFGSGHRESDSSPMTDNRGNPYLKRPGDQPYGEVVSRNTAREAFRASDFKALGHLLQQGANCFFSDASPAQQSAYIDLTQRLVTDRISDWKEAQERLLGVVDPFRNLAKINRLFLNKGGFQAAIPIPVLHGVPVGDAPLGVINTRVFQRLRCIKQLSFCDWFFPGATHTRFEHSLGVFDLMRRAMTCLVNERQFRDRYTFDDLKGALVAALLHDVGHYPFAHVVEQYASSRFSQDRVTRAAVSHSAFTKELIEHDSELNKSIEQHFGNPALVSALKTLDGNMGALSELIDGPLDCDKMDYLPRDSAHCGLKFGEGMDLVGLLRHLCCMQSGKNLGIDYLGVAAVEGFVVLQDQMLSSVYWHPTIRGIICMFHAALAHLVGNDPSKLLALVAELRKNSTEQDAIRNVILPRIKQLRRAGADDLLKLVVLHVEPSFLDIFRPICTYRATDEPPAGRRTNIYQALVQGSGSTDATVLPVNWDNVKHLRTAFLGAFVEKKISAKASDIIVDIPMGKTAHRRVSVRREDGVEEDITAVSHLNKTIFESPAIHVSPARVFISPTLFRAAHDNLSAIRTSAEKAFNDLPVPGSVKPPA